MSDCQDWAVLREGALAYKAGKLSTDCPYVMGTFRNLWQQGYREADWQSRYSPDKRTNQNDKR